MPGLSHVPLAAPRRALPGWAIAVMGVLTGAVLVLGGAWWQSQRSLTAHAPNAAPVAASPAGVESTSAPARATTPAAVVAAATPVATPSAPQATATAAPLRATVAVPPPAVEPKRESLASAATAGLASARPAPSGPTLPSAAALNAQGIGVPPLRLELHAYSDSPSERFVFINGHRYREGERLAEGPEVVTIEPDGVVLSQQGQRFMLAPE